MGNEFKEPTSLTNTMKHWTPYQPTADTPWNVQRVVHLHRRAAFAATWGEVQRDLDDGPDAAIQRLLNGHQRREQADDFAQMSGNIGDAAMASNSPVRLRAWWFYHMLKSPDPLGERLTLMWHNHFATSNRKVANLIWMREQNEIFRKHGRDSFEELLTNVVKHPAILKWLDADANRKGHPNENLARELLELFTLGFGNYTEADVLAAARALTGWTIKNDQFSISDSRHDDGELTVLGKTKKMDGDALLGLLLEQPATAKRIAWRLCDCFLGEGVCDDAAIDELAAGLARHDLDIGWAIATMLRSELFFSAENLRCRISSPAEHIVAAARALELNAPTPSTMLLADWASRMGQELFYPPNVGGWRGGRSWLGSRAVIARANFGAALAAGKLWRSRDAAEMETTLQSLLERYSVEAKRASQIKWLATLLWGSVSDDTVSTLTKSFAAADEQPEHPLAATVSLLLAQPEHLLS